MTLIFLTAQYVVGSSGDGALGYMNPWFDVV